MPLRSPEELHRYDRDDNYTFDRGRRGAEHGAPAEYDRDRWERDRGEYDRSAYDRGAMDRGYYGRGYGGGYLGTNPGESYFDRDYGRGEYTRRDYERWDRGRPEHDRNRTTHGTANDTSDYERDFSRRGDAEREYTQRMGYARPEYDRRRDTERESSWDYDYNRGPSGNTGWRGGVAESDTSIRETRDRPYGTGTQGMRTGRYGGVGPRGYQRSDERIHEDVNDRLAQHPDIDPSDVEVSARDGVVYLRGTIETRWAKRVAEDEAEAVWGVKDVINELRVSAGQTAMDATGGTSEASPLTVTTGTGTGSVAAATPTRSAKSRARSTPTTGTDEATTETAAA
jgi:hypothetical protein